MTLKGVVKDSIDAAIAGATVTISNRVIGFERSVETDSNGIYSFVGLQAGTYVLKVEAQGFAPAVRNDLVLQGGDNAITDITLQPGAPTEVVEVTSQAPMIEIMRNGISETYQNRSVADLPIISRNFSEFSLILPSVPQTGSSNIFGGATNSVNGSSIDGTNILIDGVETDSARFGPKAMPFSLESLREVQVVTVLYSADTGLSGFNSITALSKGGTNQLLGSAYFSLRDDSLQAKGPFGSPIKPDFDREQFGGSIGGRIIKDQAFYFFSAERLRENGVTAVGQRDTTARRIVQGWAPTPARHTFFTGRTDFQLGEPNSIFMRYSLHRHNGIDSGDSREGKLQDPSNFQDLTSKADQFVANWIRMFSPRMVNDFRFNLLLFKSQTEPQSTTPQIVFPSINTGANFRGDYRFKQKRIQLKDDLSWSSGQHNFKFGGDLSHDRFSEPSNYGILNQGIIFASCDFAGEPGCTDARTDSEIPVELSLVNRQTLDEGFIGFGVRGQLPALRKNILGVYAQDSYRVGTLSLTAGLRWDYEGDFLTKKQTPQPVQAKRRKKKSGVGPRVSGTYDLGKIILHGGYGKYFVGSSLEVRQLELLLDGVQLPIVRFADSTLANPFDGLAVASPPDVIINNEVKQPYVHQLSFGAKKPIGNTIIISVDYFLKRGRHFPRLVEVNRKKDGTRVDANFGSILETRYDAKSTSDGLTVKFTKRHSNLFSLDATYTLSRSINEVNDPFDIIRTSSDLTGLEFSRGPSPDESRHWFVFSGVFDLPWSIQVSSFVKASSSLPFDIVQNHDFSEGIKAGFIRLPGLGRNAGSRQVKSGADVNQIIDQSNSNPDLVRAHGGPISHVDPNIDLTRRFFSTDLRAVRYFSFGEERRLGIGCEVFNLFNHVNIFGISNHNPSGLQNNVENPNFGKPLGLTPRGVFGFGGPRALQLSARLYF